MKMYIEEHYRTAKKGRVFTFHWRGGYLTKAVLEELLELIQKAGKEKQKNARNQFELAAGGIAI